LELEESEMVKVFLIVILALILTCIIMFIIIKSQESKNKELQNQIDDYKSSYFELNNKFEKLLEEMEIEKRHKKELAKKLADISCMSIDDVLGKLQNNNS
jgi:predicted PurR-regulated permease PerM